MFRAGMIVLTALCWGVALLVAGHRSSHPSVLGQWSPHWTLLVAGTVVVALLATLAHRRSWYSRLHARRHHFALLFGTIAFELVLIECALRCFDPFGLSYFESSLAYDLDKVVLEEKPLVAEGVTFDHDLIFWNRPNLRATYGGIHAATNELGMRDDPLLPKKPGELRVAAIGDSVTFGWGVEREETWCFKLQQRLAAERAGRGGARVLDTGCGGYDSQQELALLRCLGDKLQPDVVLLLYVPNDVEMNVPPFRPLHQFELTGKSVPETAMALLRHSWLGRFAFFVQRQQQMTVAPPTPRPIGWRTSMDSVAAMKSWCDQRKLPFVVVLWRPRSDLNTDALYADLGALGKEKQFPVVDSLPWLKDVPKRELCISPVDAHPTPRTHTLLAEGMFEALRELKLVGQ